MSNLMKCFKPACDTAFNKEHNMNGWRIEGMIPFTRHALWKKVEENAVIASNSTPPGSLPSSTPSPDVVATLDSNTTLPNPGGLLATPPLDPSAPPFSLPSIPDAVLKAGDYMRSCAPAASGILDMETIIMQNLKLLEASKVIGEWMRTSTIEEDNETNMAKRISSRDIYGEAGSASGDTALAMLKAKEDKRVAVVVAAVAKKDQTKDKRARDTTALFTIGSEIMMRLELLGPSELHRL